jgi:hypothetical protein
MQISEYDAFGPWIIEVEQPSDVPRLYRDYPLDFDRALLVFKVPRNISRRDANPTMNLYDVLLIAEADRLIVLRRDSESTYAASTIELSSVYAVEDSVSLLDGRLLIHSSEHEPVLVEYNGSARTTVTRLVSLLRALIAPADRAALPAVSDAVAAASSLLAGEADYGLRGASVELLAGEPSVRVVAGHATLPIHPTGGSIARLSHAFRPAFLQGALAIEVPSAVLILRRRDEVVRGRHDDLSHSFTVVFTDRVTETSRAPHRLYGEIEVLSIRGGASALEVLIPAGSEFSLPFGVPSKS